MRAFGWGQMVHGEIKVPVWLHKPQLSSYPCCPLSQLPSKLHSQRDLLCFKPSPEHKCRPRLLVCYLSGMGVRQSGSFPQSRTKANRKAHKHTGPLQRSGPRLLGPATHLPLLMPQVPLTSPHTWEELQPACLKKYSPQGYPSRQNRQSTGFDKEGRTAELNSSVSSWFTSVSNQTSS